jgi:small subunit ribosomal protein S5
MAKHSEGGKKEGNESNLMEKVLFINRCSKTVTGGKKLSFSALILVGDGKGRVGFGFAKANELTDAIRKGGEAARKNMITVPMEGSTIPHDVHVKWDGVTLLMRSAPQGTGISAGSKVKSVLQFAGYKDVVAKIIGSNNAVNQVRAAFEGLSKLCMRDEILKARGVKHESE